MIAIFKKEFRSLFLTPMGYIILFVFSLFSGIVFLTTAIGSGYSDMTSFFSSMLIFVAFTISILCMKFFSEERKTKTEQLLLTAPVNLTDIVLGKFLAGLAVYLLCICETFVLTGIMGFVGEPDWGVIFVSYIGYILLGAALISIGIFFSSITQNQIIAAIVTLLVFIGLMLSANLINYLASLLATIGKGLELILTSLFNVLPIFDRYSEFAYGILNISTIIYYLSIVVIFLFLTTRVLEKRRWS